MPFAVKRVDGPAPRPLDLTFARAILTVQVLYLRLSVYAAELRNL